MSIRATQPFAELLDKIPIPSTHRFYKAQKYLDSVIYGIIRERRASGVDRGDLLSMLMLAQDEQGDGSGMTDSQLRDEAMTLFLAGHETTANALVWTWYLLSQHPEIEATLHDELDTVLAGKLPTVDDLKQLQYTRMVFAESLRLYPPVWGMDRFAIKDYEVGPYVIPAGSVIIVSQYVMHRDPRFYPEPLKFDPERWTVEGQAARSRLSYFPFGSGHRQCIGESFAWVEAMLIMATIAQRWQMRLVPGHSAEPQALVTLRPKYGMRMILKQRMN